jgi:hypothetical protein
MRIRDFTRSICAPTCPDRSAMVWTLEACVAQVFGLARVLLPKGLGSYLSCLEDLGNARRRKVANECVTAPNLRFGASGGV